MTAKTTLQATVTDTNGRNRGVMDILVEFSKLAPNITRRKDFLRNWQRGRQHEDRQRSGRSSKRRRSGAHLDCTRCNVHLGRLNATQSD